MRIYYANMQQRVDKIQHFFFVALVSSMSIHLIFAKKKQCTHTGLCYKTVVMAFWIHIFASTQVHT